MRLDFLADDVNTGGHGTLVPSSVSIGRMSAWREPVESVKPKCTKVLSTETVHGCDLLGCEHECRQCSAPSRSKFIVGAKRERGSVFHFDQLVQIPSK